MAGRIFLANVGANTSHRFNSPLFPDGTFEFIPIPEDRHLSGPSVIRYRDLRSYNNPHEELLRYIPERLWDWPTHNDPEFETFTYGDNCETSPRAASLKRLESGDFLLFLARLTLYRDGQFTTEAGFYLIGYLQIEEVLPRVEEPPRERLLERFRNNAHVRRGLDDSVSWDGFWVFRGSANSRRFQRAVPLTLDLAMALFTTADGTPWRWEDTRSPLQIIGSYTRSCRCVIDPALPQQGDRANLLWQEVNELNPEARFL